ncbi:acyltransferase family protein [Scleromatobacter humisilvae]|uniref:Acyltransferase n=1 Tax=Scleromatobacter humisilvae TaxID=2897159 RepID=A0A9X1YHL8_9BURK|nr:acyltransferase [Scleromatobacter humisilvae]MCK9685887.1 acyltransferase [Scleromatobacter humisilvae]
MKHLPALDGIRAAAILIVMISHIVTPLVPGGFGVTLFFFVSGFIITRMMLSQSFGGGHLKAFYVRRVFRLAPALMVFLLVSGIVMSSLGDPIPARDFVATLCYYANYHQFTNFGHVLSPLVITWSLAVEEHFYFIFPVLLILTRRRLVTALTSTILAILVWRLVLVYGFHAPTARTYVATDTRLDSIAFGCLLSVMIDVRHRLLPALASRGALWASGILLLLSFAIRRDDFRETFRYTLHGLALMPIFCKLFWQEAPLQPLRAILESAVARYVGNVSYSLYLYHFLALSVATALLPDGAFMKACTFVSAFALASVSYYLVENPVRRLGSRLARSMEAATAPPAGAIERP